MESIGHTHTHSRRNFHSYGTTVVVHRASYAASSARLVHIRNMGKVGLPNLAAQAAQASRWIDPH